MTQPRSAGGSLMAPATGVVSNSPTPAGVVSNNPPPPGVVFNNPSPGGDPGFEDKNKVRNVAVGCTLSADQTAILQGSASPVKIRLTVFGSPESATFNGQPILPLNADFTVNPAVSTLYTAEVVREGESKNCQVSIKVVKLDEKFDGTQALCANKEGLDRKILVINFYNPTAPFYNPTSDLIADFVEIKNLTGIDATVITGNIESELDESYDAIWLLSSENSTQIGPTIKAKLKALADRGVGIVYLADNAPYFAEANELLGFIRPEWNILLAGNYIGEKTVGRKGFPTSGSGFLSEHPIISGIFQSVSEGTSISDIRKGRPNVRSVIEDQSYTPILINSQGNVSVAAIEQDLSDASLARQGAPTKAGKPQGRAIIHGGYTSLFRQGSSANFGWQAKVSPATPLFFANMACWSVGAK